MAEPADPTVRSASGTEISERSSELVLPDAPGVRAREIVWRRINGWRASNVDRVSPPSDSTTKRPVMAAKRRETRENAEQAARPRGIAVSQPEGPTASQPTPEATRATYAGAPSDRPPTPSLERGRALPGDRGPRSPAPAAGADEAQRPSFWRRIALGRRSRRVRAAEAMNESQALAAEAAAPTKASAAEAQAPSPLTPDRSAAPATTPSRASEVEPKLSATDLAPVAEIVEQRVVEPMLQALVSVEAKLERSHADLTLRSDGVEQRLTQLWDIEEQLGALSEIQESLLHVAEQQRRLEAALIAQRRTLRWTVGSVMVALVAAAFVVAAVLR